MVEARGWAEKFERWNRMIPGMKGYQDKEAFRDCDKAVRMKVAEKLNGIKDVINSWKRDLVDGKKLMELDAVDRALRKIEGLADRIRYDSYGYSGYFDPVKIREPELERIYQFDLGLFDGVEKIAEAARNAGAKGSADIRAGARAIEDAAALFEKQLEDRRSFSNPNPPV